MAAHTGTHIKTELDVCLGKVGTPVGKLVFVRNGPRMFTQFAYFQSWLEDEETFNVSPDLTAALTYQTRKPASKEDSLFFLAMGDTAPDAWGLAFAGQPWSLLAIGPGR